MISPNQQPHGTIAYFVSYVFFFNDVGSAPGFGHASIFRDGPIETGSDILEIQNRLMEDIEFKMNNVKGISIINWRRFET